MPDRAPNQSTASAELDKTTMNRLIEKANERDKQRLKRLDCEPANAWITAQPSTLDGKDTILPPKLFLTAVSRLLGLSVYPDSVPCPLDGRPRPLHATQQIAQLDLQASGRRKRVFWATQHRANVALLTLQFPIGVGGNLAIDVSDLSSGSFPHLTGATV